MDATTSQAPVPRLQAHDSDEDWTVLTDPKARRKVQNRLNVRAHRKRRAERARAVDPRAAATEEERSSYERTVLTQSAVQSMTDIVPGVPLWLGPQTHKSSDESLRALQAALPYSRRWTVSRQSSNKCIQLALEGRSPLSSDHLIPMVQYNLVRATITNAAILDVVHLLPGHDDCRVLHDHMPLFPRPGGASSSSGPPEVPPSLSPTALQRSIPHEYWVDLMPDPAVRDNIILALSDGTLDPIELQADLLGSVCRDAILAARHWARANNIPRRAYEKEDREPLSLAEQGKIGLIAWSTPWSADGYEMSEDFAHKYRYLLRGSWELLAATNRWRQIRGEEPIILDP